MILYIFISYLLTAGMMIESYAKNSIPLEAYLIWALSPLTCPIIIGMDIAKKRS
jgi:hypothetical protein